MKKNNCMGCIEHCIYKSRLNMNAHECIGALMIHKVNLIVAVTFLWVLRDNSLARFFNRFIIAIEVMCFCKCTIFGLFKCRVGVI